MSFNPFKTVKDYSEMLNKIAFFNFFGGLIILVFLGVYIPQIKDYLIKININVKVSEVELPIIAVGIPFFIAIVSRIIKLHDRISDLLGIRKRYDVKNILIPIAHFIGYNQDDLVNKIKNSRVELMRKVFYRYASSIESKCEIDYHNVIMAMDQLSWFWIIIELMALLLIGIIISLIFYTPWLTMGFILTFLIFFIFSFIVLSFCEKYTRIEVNEILEDQNRVSNIRQVYNAL